MSIFNHVQQPVAGKIAGQPIVAPQLGMSAFQWRNGYGVPSDGQDTNRNHPAAVKQTPDTKSIIIYFSRSGSTELLAAKIAQQTGADIHEIVVQDTYPASYRKTLSRANYERENQDYPELAMGKLDLHQYSTVYLGYPIWAMTLSHPMTAFLNTYGSQLAGKRIIPFMTEGGYGQGDSVQRIDQLLRSQGVQARVDHRPLVVDGNKVDRADAQVDRWLASKA